MRFGERWPAKHDLSSLRLLGSVGEPINPEAWRWYHDVIGQGKCPIIDTWWQTETGGFMVCPLPVTPLKPGSATKPFFGNEITIVDEDGEEVPAGEEGKLIINNPWPGMARTVFKDDQRYQDLYWSQSGDKWRYLAGDSAKKDEDGYIWVIGRMDEVLKVSGYRLGTAEIESALVSHPSVSEAAAVGLPHELKGNAIHTYVILKQGVTADKALEKELKAHVGNEMGKIATPEAVEFVDALPKTRSGKIMRRVLKARALGQDEGDLSTLEE
jgi:acetyl-CoA synthetase